MVIINDPVPHNRDLVVTELDSMALKHGAHTLEIVHETPFGQDVLAQQTIQVDRLIEFKGSVVSQE